MTLRGRVAATGFALDLGVIGEAEARRRVLAAWAPGASLRRLPYGDWLLVLPAPVETRFEAAPGLPLEGRDGGLVAAGLDAVPGAVVLPRAGEVLRLPLTELPAVSIGDWFDLSAYPVVPLSPVDGVPVGSGPGRATVPPPIDLRAAAKVGPASARTRELVEQRRQSGSGGFAKLVLRTPLLGGVFRSRQERYLSELAAKFARRDWDAALREAIALGTGAGPVHPSLLLPAGRSVVTPSVRPSASAAGSVLGSPGTQARLRDLYVRAAAELEAAGRYVEAAFVHVDLLKAPADAVSMLERHRQFELAARLAEGHRLPAGQTAWLWWRAGNTARAVAVARARGGFAVAVDRITATDPAGGRELRRAWAEALRAAGDHLGAVEAAWPDETLRPGVVADIQRGLALGGPDTGRLFAYLLGATPTPKVRAGALALLADDDAAGAAIRAALGSALAEVPVGDPVADREVVTAAVRAVLRDGAKLGRPLRQLVKRADPLVAADLPTSIRPKGVPAGPVTVDGPTVPGQLPVHDAVTLAGGAILVAHGEAGVRLLTLDGRVRARWHIPTSELVVADHGGSAVFVAPGGELYRLDLASRSVRRIGPVSARILPTYDGGVLVTVGVEGIEFVDVLGLPEVVWREVDATHVVRLLDRTPTTLTGVIDVPVGWQAGRIERQLWSWELPGMALRVRRNLDAGLTRAVVVGDGLAARAADGTWSTFAGYGPVTPLRLPPDATPIALGGALGVRTETTVRLDGAFTVSLPGARDLGARAHAGIVTVWSTDGRIVAVRQRDGVVSANFRTVV